MRAVFEMAGSSELFHLLTYGKREDVISKIGDDPVEYMSLSKFTEDDIVHCICKALVSWGDTDIAYKLRLLLVFQEHTTVFMTTVDCLEETIGCLSNYHTQLKSPGHMFLKCQILVTITTLLLNFEDKNEEAFGTLFSKHCDHLWQLLAMVNHKDNCLLRETACECLIEIEASYPCIFLNYLEKLSFICFIENFYPFQNYANFISCVIKNAAKITPLTSTNRMLALMKKSEIVDDPTVTLSTSDVGKIVTKLLDILPLCSCTSVQYIVSNIFFSAKLLHLNPFIFKTFLHRFMMTSNLMIFHTILKLKEIFENNVFSNYEERIVWQLLIDKANHSALTDNERCMALGWISHDLINQIGEKTKQQGSSLVRDSPFFLHLPFDSLDVVARKMNILFVLFPRCEDAESCQHVLQTFLQEIYSHLSHDDKGYYVTSLYRVIYCCLSQNIAITESEHQQIAVSVIKEHPQFSMHTLDLVNNAKQLNPKSSFSTDILSTAVYHITNLPVESIQGHLHYYLQFLTEAAEEKAEHSQPKAIIKFLHGILDGRNLETGEDSSWLIGHALLDICKRILCYHTTNSIYSDFGELLYKIISKYGDIDVQDRAQFYYMLLTTLSPRKISAMFKPKAKKMNRSDGIANFISGDACFSFPAPVLHLQEPKLKLSSINNDDQWGSFHAAAIENGDVNEYLQCLKESKLTWNASKDFNLQITSKVDDTYSDIYGIVLSFSAPNCCGKIPSVRVPYVSKDEGSIISVQLAPLQPLPASISVNAMFSSSNGCTCYNELLPVDLKFEDLFQPLPVPSQQHFNPDKWRSQLATLLWDKFTLHSVKDCDAHQSVLRLHLNESQYQELRTKHFRPFITEENSGDLQPMFTVGVFLPPKNHLIMKIECKQSQHVMVSLATDSSDVLAQINLYFCRIEKLLQQCYKSGDINFSSK